MADIQPDQVLKFPGSKLVRVSAYTSKTRTGSRSLLSIFFSSPLARYSCMLFAFPGEFDEPVKLFLILHHFALALPV